MDKKVYWCQKEQNKREITLKYINKDGEEENEKKDEIEMKIR